MSTTNGNTNANGTTPPKERRPKLRIITYLSPGVPVAIFEAIRDLLEVETGLEAYLICESRWSGPPLDREDPFTADDVDLGFMCSTTYLRQKQKKNQFMELCTAAPLHSHPMAAGKPVYFSEVMVHKDNKERFKDFHSLKGCRWAYNEEISLSGNLVMLAELKRKGFNASFFGSSTQTGSHLQSLQMVLSGRADVAAIDSNVWAGFSLEHPERAKQLVKVMSLGPMPVYPSVFNSRLPAEVKDKITSALLNLDKNPEWGQRLLQLGITGFSKVDDTFYTMEDEIRALVKNMSIAPAYY